VGIELSPGDRVGDYSVEATIGRGATAHVYRALSPDGTAVALKLILPDLANDEIFRHRFDLEVSTAQRISHPNVVSVLDSGDHEGNLWLTQVLCQGGSLVQRLADSGGSLTVQQTVTLVGEVASGLDAVHAAGLVHRDMKPANILFDEDGTVRITDFGLARDTSSDRRWTRPGQTLGSMAYMAPEQIEAEDVGPFTDVYALGCVTYECIVGATPFADRPGMGVLLAHLDAEPPHPSDRVDGLPRGLGDAIVAALAKAPAERPASASAYAELLRSAAALPA
jgi:serine/threonine-protein kinase